RLDGARPPGGAEARRPRPGRREPAGGGAAERGPARREPRRRRPRRGRSAGRPPLGRLPPLGGPALGRPARRRPGGGRPRGGRSARRRPAGREPLRLPPRGGGPARRPPLLPRRGGGGEVGRASGTAGFALTIYPDSPFLLDAASRGHAPDPLVIAPAQELESRKVFSVSRVVERADQVLREAARHPIWVRGEVSGWKRYGSGHCYFCLKDEKAELECVLWKDRA